MLIKRFVTPMAINVVYVIGVVLCVLGCGFYLVSASAVQGAAAFALAMQGFMSLVVGPLVLRVICELVLVVFRIHEKLESVDSKLALLSAGKVPTKSA